MNTSLVKKQALPILFALLGTYFTFPVYFERILFSINDYSENWLSLDPSWVLALTKAFNKNLVFGTEFTLTYGPLGFLTTRLMLGINKYGLLAFDVFFALNIFFVFYYTFTRSASKAPVLLLVGLSVLPLPVFYGPGTSILLMAIQLFWLTHYLTNQKFMAIIAAMLLSALLLFMKFNTGFISVFLLFMVMIYTFITQTNTRKQLALLTLLFVLLLNVSFRLLNVSPVPYFKTGLLMVKGYADVMFLNLQKNSELFFAVFCVITCFALLLNSLVKLKIKWHLSVVILLLYAAPAFVLYKQGFTRADDQHILEFYSYFPFLLLAFPQLVNLQKLRLMNYLPIVPALICYSFTVFSEKNGLETFIRRINKSPYVKAFLAYNANSGCRIDSTQNQLPNTIKNKIAGATIDAYPWNLVELDENKLNTTTRPVIQSYTAYTKELEQINAAYYNSELAPQYVLYDFASIDNRYPLGDEPLLNLKLFNCYSLSDTLHSYGRFKLLLKKNTNCKISLLPVKTYKSSVFTKIIPNADTYYEISLKKTVWGKLQSLLWHPPELVLQVMNGNKELFEYHTSAQLLETGIFSNIHYNTTTDVFNMFTKKQIEKQNKIIFYGVRAINAGFEDEMTIREYKIIK